jgi:hypothetical protein
VPNRSGNVKWIRRQCSGDLVSGFRNDALEFPIDGTEVATTRRIHSSIDVGRIGLFVKGPMFHDAQDVSESRDPPHMTKLVDLTRYRIRGVHQLPFIEVINDGLKALHQEYVGTVPFSGNLEVNLKKVNCRVTLICLSGLV